MLFLKKIKRIEVKENGKPLRCFERVDEGNSLILTDGHNQDNRIWHLISGDFAATAAGLRESHLGRIETKRSAKVLLAIPQSRLETGLLCACLPSQHETGLPFHVNADFFPSNDRKHIIFGSDYQAQWNRAALKAAAEALADSLVRLPAMLGHTAFWNLVARIQQVAEEAEKGHREKSLSEFWTALAPKLKRARIAFTNQREWKEPAEALILLQKEENCVFR
jgi:hypothetical protein